MKIFKWETLVSNYMLNFRSLIDRGKAIFEVETESGIVFEVILESTGEGCCGPYVIVEEEHMTDYWHIREKNIGSTFIVEPSYLLKHFLIILEPEKYKHYVIATSSICLEVLSQIPPEIRRIGD